ncbi:hypothetical protein [Mastigocladopsis repens]|uniref:hypothetical protein n=1 Tax=Mastigocladopsis repens TaxID=221287 RepID=UPI001E41D0D3|nr:hypothetical protein [Mastigocladopsis repens]
MFNRWRIYVWVGGNTGMDDWAEDMSCISPYPKEPLWMMVKIPGGTRRHYNDELAVCAIGSHIV